VASADVKTDGNASPVIDALPIVNPALSLLVPTPVADIVPPTIKSPVLGSINLLNSNFSGGTASVVTITAYSSLTSLEDLSLVYRSDLTRNCTASWSASGSLCNTTGTADDKTTSVQSSTDIGAK
jgi:hypothetical protein